jgi:SAM-dependent methyltransferase
VIGVDLAENLLILGRTEAANRGLQNIEFRVGDMENLDFPDGCFDAVISVFSIFFVDDMENLVHKLWRLVRPGGQLAVTTWGPNFCEPMHTRWQETLQRLRPGLYSGFRPWERLTTPEAVRQLLAGGGISEADIVPESGNQPLRSPDDWWAIVLGSGFRWTVEQLEPEIVTQVRDDNLRWASDFDVKKVETNVVYALATKR